MLAYVAHPQPLQRSMSVVTGPTASVPFIQLNAMLDVSGDSAPNTVGTVGAVVSAAVPSVTAYPVVLPSLFESTT